MRELATETVIFENVALTVGEASVGMGMVRSRLKMDALRELRELGEAFDPASDMHLMQVISYPDVMGALVEWTGPGKPKSFTEFLQLPDALLTRWMDAAYRLNPHWLDLPGVNEPAEEKKESPSSSGSKPRPRHRKGTAS